MGFKEVASLDADTVVSVGKKDKKTGKMGPKQVEGYYLGTRTVENKRGESALHFLQTPEGNLGVWGTTDMNRKLKGVKPGTMTRITASGTKPTPNGDMYVYKVEQDLDNVIKVDASLSASGSEDVEASDAGGYEDYQEDTEQEVEQEQDDTPPPTRALGNPEQRRSAVNSILNKGKRQ